MIEKNINKIKTMAKLSEKENEWLLGAIESNLISFKNLDSLVKNYYEDIKNEIECDKCGECCKSVIIIFEENDVDRLASHLKIKRDNVLTKWFQKYEKFNCYVMNQLPCLFQKDGLCTVYKHRGTECREFPYLESMPFSEIYKYAFQGYAVCSFYYNIIEMLKNIPEFKYKKHE